MQTQKTKKGQPVMRNYVKYALAKLEETLEKEKHQKQQKTKWLKHTSFIRHISRDRLSL